LGADIHQFEPEMEQLFVLAVKNGVDPSAIATETGAARGYRFYPQWGPGQVLTKLVTKAEPDIDRARVVAIESYLRRHLVDCLELYPDMTFPLHRKILEYGLREDLSPLNWNLHTHEWGLLKAKPDYFRVFKMNLLTFADCECHEPMLIFQVLINEL
jgi:hypothetical protein